MNCQDVREHFSALLVGHIGLTEQVPLEAHLRQCDACQQELEGLRTRDRARPSGWRPNLDRIGNGPLRLAVTATLAALVALGLFRYRAELGVAIRPWVPSAPSTSDAPATTVPAPPVLYPSPVPSARERLSEVTTPAELPPLRRSPAPSPPVHDTRATRLAKPEVSKPAQVEQPPQRNNASETASASAPQVAGDARPSPDVVGKLRVKSRSGAERDLAALLAEAGGSTVSWQRGEKITVVEAVIPNRSYDRFAEGLTRIGSWQIEAERSRLPDPVRFSMRLAE
jgi:putative zinc finger protein